MNDLQDGTSESATEADKGSPEWMQAPEGFNYQAWANTDEKTAGLLRVLASINKMSRLAALTQERVQNELNGRRIVKSDRPVKPLGALIHEMADAATRLGLTGFQVARDLDVAPVVDPEQVAAEMEDEAAALEFDRKLAEAVSAASAAGDPSALLKLAFPPGTAPEDMKITPPSVIPPQESPPDSQP